MSCSSHSHSVQAEALIGAFCTEHIVDLVADPLLFCFAALARFHIVGGLIGWRRDRQRKWVINVK